MLVWLIKNSWLVKIFLNAYYLNFNGFVGLTQKILRYEILYKNFILGIQYQIKNYFMLI